MKKQPTKAGSLSYYQVVNGMKLQDLQDNQDSNLEAGQTKSNYIFTQNPLILSDLSD